MYKTLYKKWNNNKKQKHFLKIYSNLSFLSSYIKIGKKNFEKINAHFQEEILVAHFNVFTYGNNFSQSLYISTKQRFPLLSTFQFNLLLLKFQRSSKIHRRRRSKSIRTDHNIHASILIARKVLSASIRCVHEGDQEDEARGSIDDARSIHAVGIPLIEDRSSIGRGRIACGGR